MSQIPKVAFVHDGARLHYALPLAVQRAGMLERMICDWYSNGIVERAAGRMISLVRPNLARKLNGRFAEELDSRKVVNNPWLLARWMSRNNWRGMQEAFEWFSSQTMRWAMKAGYGRANVLMGFVRNIHPRLCEQWRRRGLKVVADQII